MSSIYGALRTALTGLGSSQSSMQVLSNNIANVNTEGYSRKYVNQNPILSGGKGLGVSVSEVQRKVDDQLITELRSQNTETAGLSVTDRFLAQLQGRFGTLADNATLSHIIGAFGDSVEALAATPESPELRFSMVNEAESVSRNIKSLHDTLQEARLQADQEITDAVSQVNDYLGQVSELNQRIIKEEGVGASSAGLKDERDKLVLKITELMDIRSFTRSTGELVIMNSNGRTLVDGPARELTHTAVNSMSADVAYVAGGSSAGNGQVDGIYIGGLIANNDVTADFRGGKIGALIALRDSTLTGMGNQLEELASEMVFAVNAAHNAGSASPAPNALTGTRTVAGTDTIGATASGAFTVQVVDSSGIVAGKWTSADLSTYADVDAMMTDFNTALSPGTATMAINASGYLTVTAAGSNGIAINGGTAAVVDGAGTSRGASHYFGLNDLFTKGVAATATVAATIGVRSDIVTNPDLLAAATASGTAVAGEVAVTRGDGTAMEALATALNGNNTFDATGGLPSMSTPFSQYAAAIVSYLASKADNTERELSFGESYQRSLEFKAAASSGVNMDEELSNMILLQNAYQAAARVMQAASDMLELLGTIGA